MNKEFNKYAVLEHGISSMTMHRYQSVLDSYINPTIIEERKLNVASMDVFSRLMMDRIIFLGVPIDDDVANIITAQLLFLASSDSSSDISLYINTPGGQVHSGLSIYDTMQIIEPDVATICTGMAASMGSVLLCAGTQGKRSALKHSRVMIHQPSSGTEGKITDQEIALKEGIYLKKRLAEIFAKNTGKDLKQVEKDMDRDNWMSAEEAKKYGIVDEVVKN
jgi:ATP-dependent Clp protease protease subunit